MTVEELGSSLQTLLSTLKKNRDQVPLETLRTYYKVPYEALLAKIRETATEFVKAVVLTDLPADPDADLSTQIHVIQRTISDSGMEKQMARCISQTYDVQRLYQMALELRRQVEQALEPFTAQKTCLVADPADIEKPPVIYNTITKKIYENGQWIGKAMDLNGKLLLFPITQSNTFRKGANL